jgi:hypothetical protein
VVAAYARVNVSKELTPLRDVLTPKFGKEYDMWVRFGKESVW